jgi:acetate kinase
MLAASLNGIDAFVFTAGVGENSAAMRARIAGRIAWLGAELDPAANASGETLISRRGSRIPLYIVATNEELMIARHAVGLLSRSGKHRSEERHEAIR